MEHRYFDAFVMDSEASHTIDVEHEVIATINDPEDDEDGEGTGWDDLELDVQPEIMMS
jgi:hypothetical protein